MDDAFVPFLVLTVALAAVSLVQFVLTRSGATREMGPNRMVGIRTTSTLRSAGAWNAGHAAAQPALLAAGVTGLGAAVPLGGVGLPDAGRGRAAGRLPRLRAGRGRPAGARGALRRPRGG